MKKTLKFLATMLFMASFGFSMAACGNNQSTDEGEGESRLVENLVTEVTVVYNKKKLTSGLLELDLSQGSVTVSADVRTVGEPTYTVTYSVDDTSIVEITNRGVITIKKAGETVLTVTAGGKKHQVVIVVSDGYGGSSTLYSVTVEGGTASATSVKEGGHVQLRVDNEALAREHKEFVGWQYLNEATGEPIDDLWINGSVFRMPNYNVIVRAILQEKLYKLNLVDATIKTCTTGDGPVVPDYTEEDGIRTYALPYNTEVTIKADQAAAGKMFVGFDVGARKNRLGDLGVEEYSFTMPGNTYSIFAMFSSTRKIEFTGYSALGVSGKAITDGVRKDEEEPVPELNGYSGYSFSFSSTKEATEEGSFPSGGFSGCKDFSTLKYGSQTIKAIYKNNSDQAFKVELYSEQYSTVVASGVVDIPAHGVVTAMHIAQTGFHNPNFGLVLREACHGGTDTTIPLDVVFVSADTYPDGDPMFAVPEAQYVTLKSLSNSADFPAGSGIRPDCFQCGPTAASTAGAPTSGSFGGRRNTNNNNGITHMVLRDSYITYSTDPSSYPYIYAEANNQPDFDENAEVTVFFRIMNTSNNTGTFVFGVGKSTSVLTDADKVTASIVLTPSQTIVFGITYVRKQASDKLVISLTRPTRGSKVDFNISVQMMYNNKIGCLDENIHSASND